MEVDIVQDRTDDGTNIEWEEWYPRLGYKLEKELIEWFDAVPEAMGNLESLLGCTKDEYIRDILDDYFYYYICDEEE